MNNTKQIDEEKIRELSRNIQKDEEKRRLQEERQQETKRLNDETRRKQNEIQRLKEERREIEKTRLNLMKQQKRNNTNEQLTNNKKEQLSNTNKDIEQLAERLNADKEISYTNEYSVEHYFHIGNGRYVAKEQYKPAEDSVYGNVSGYIAEPVQQLCNNHVVAYKYHLIVD